MNKSLLNLPDFIKIGVISVLALMLAKWALKTMGMTTYEKYI